MGRTAHEISGRREAGDHPLVEQSPLSVRQTLAKLGIPRATFYRWYDLYQTDGPEGLADRSPRPDRVWNRIPDAVRQRIRTLAWTSRHSPLANWPCVSPTPKATLCQKLRS